MAEVKRRTRPERLSEEELIASYREPWYVRVQRMLSWPFLWIRRRILRLVDPRKKNGERGRGHDDEAMGVL